VWPKVFEANRRAILGAGMISVAGHIQREGEVVHLVVQRITDLSTELASIGKRGDAFPLTHGRGDEFRATGGSLPGNTGTPTPRDIYIPDLHIDTVRVKSKDFR
ncbi:DNA polymerase III subunit alpha, partial [Paracoccus aestuarii]